MSGVYAIRNIDKDKYYVGSAADLRKRLMRWPSRLKGVKRRDVSRELWEDWQAGYQFEFLIVYATEYHQLEHCLLSQLGVDKLYNKTRASQHPKLTPEDERHFWSFVYRHPQGCWEWMGGLKGGKGKGEYGHWHHGGKDYRANRIAYLIWYGEAAFYPSLHVLHSCSNKLCVNPVHLSLGTNQENTVDYFQRERKK